MKDLSHHLRGNKTKKIQSFDLIIFIHSWIDVEGRHRQPDIWEYTHLNELENAHSSAGEMNTSAEKNLCVTLM